jgi:hypothetical protein
LQGVGFMDRNGVCQLVVGTSTSTTPCSRVPPKDDSRAWSLASKTDDTFLYNMRFLHWFLPFGAFVRVGARLVRQEHHPREVKDCNDCNDCMHAGWMDPTYGFVLACARAHPTLRRRLIGIRVVY